MASQTKAASAPERLAISTTTSARKTFDYQNDAITKLERLLVKNDQQAAMLVIPTGGGKTFTAVYLAFTQFVSKGYKLVWIAHRADLLEQAKKTMVQEAGLLKGMAKGPLLHIIGGGYDAGTTLSRKKYDINIISIQSLRYRTGVSALKAFCKNNVDEKVLFVIDEAHHSVATTYKKIINEFIKPNKQFKLLGLSATPTRTNEGERPILMKMYDNNYVQTVSVNDLIKRGYLSIPKPEKIQTNIQFEKESIAVSEKVEKYFESLHELHPDLIAKIRESAVRNEIIVATYLKNKDRYKKTLIFAIDSIHAETLLNEFRRHPSVKCDMTRAGVEGHKEKIEMFADDQLDVLINIAKLTEGYDNPKIQTVFLTRPTQSEILFSQMIGRGLRSGKNGTKEAYLVSFEDHWDKFTGWLDAESYLNFQGIELEHQPKKLSPKPETSIIPISVITNIYQDLRQILPTESIESMPFECWPLGWFNVEMEVEKNFTTRPILVFSHQKKSWDEVIELLPETKPKKTLVDALYADWFEDIPTPNVSKEVFQLFVDACYQDEEKDIPDYFLFDDRDNASPDKLAKELYETPLNGAMRSAKVKDWYKNFPVLNSLYRTEEDFKRAVDEATLKIDYPDTNKSLIIPGNPFLDLERIKLNIPEPNDSDLKKIVHELAKDKILFPSGFNHKPAIKWTNRVMKSYFGMAYVDKKEIKINRILNAPFEKQAEALRFIVYHEMLHIELGKKHDAEFYNREATYNDSAELDGIIDSLTHDYDIPGMNHLAGC